MEYNPEYKRGFQDGQAKRWRPPPGDPYGTSRDVAFHSYRHGYVAGLETPLPLKTQQIILPKLNHPPLGKQKLP